MNGNSLLAAELNGQIKPTLMARLREAVPPLRQVAAGALIWAIAMGASATLGLLLLEWRTISHIRDIVSVFLLGGAIAFPLGLYAARLFSQDRPASSRFAAAMVGFTLATVAITGLVFAFDYRNYYSQWHDHAFSIRWFFELAFTTGGALYLYAVVGLRLFFPIGFLCLFLASLWFARSKD